MNREEQSPTTHSDALSRRGFVILGGAVGAAGIVGAIPGTAAVATTKSATRGGHDAAALTTAQSLGVNTTSGDRRFADPEIPQLLREAAIGLIRYPGGSGADGFDWRTGGPITWPMYLQIAGDAGAAPLVTLNYGRLAQGPEAAGAWVADAVTRPGWDSSTALWVLGNEGYGPWERDEHPDPHTPGSYATYARDYFKAVHAADPSARVGFPMTIDRAVAGGTGTWVADPDLWNRTVLTKNRDQVDWIDFHWYPVFGIPVLTNAQIFETVGRIPGAMKYIQGVIDRAGSKAPVFVSESNISQSEVVYNAHPVAALYAAATALTFLAHGAHSFLWWQVHNTDNMNGDFGFLSDGTGTPGPSTTTLATPARSGATHIDVADTTGFYYGHRFTIGAGADLESRKITAIGGSTRLAASAGARSRVLKVDSVVPFAPGTEITVGEGTSAERHTVTAVGTGAGTTSLAAPASRGDRTLRIVGEGMGGQSIQVFMPISLTPGGRVVIGSGSAAETAVIDEVGTSSSLGTTTVAPVTPGDRTVYVAVIANSNTGIAHYVGDLMTVGDGEQVEYGIITAAGTAAATAATTAAAARRGDTAVRLAVATNLTPGHALQIGAGDSAERAFVASVGAAGPDGAVVKLTAPLRHDHADGETARDLGTGITLDRPLKQAHAAGVAARDAGSGLRLTAPLSRNHANGTTVTTEGTGISLSAPLSRQHAAGEAAVSTGITFTPPLKASHPRGTTVDETGLKEPAPNTPMPAYWGYVLTSLLTEPGARIAVLPSHSPTVLAFQSFWPGRTAVMLINTDDARGAAASVAGLTATGGHGGVLRTSRYGLENPEVTEGSTTVAQVAAGLELAPESITVLVADTGKRRAQETGDLSLRVRPARS
ncbi:hypothetical protein [Streptomyces sp. NPDC051569]|uniref:hypothetical protein n=1 Tax=Streptomyces sp. NPDC051569 TaxID=3365661 RepID=UPI0037AD4C09